MRVFVLAGMLCALAGSAFAQGATCKSQVADKKLVGAAMSSFMKKCETDAQKSCDASAAEKKLAGAAKASFTKKCVSDTVGS